MANNRQLRTASFFSFSKQDFYLSRLRTEAAEQQKEFYEMLKFVHGIYKDDAALLKAIKVKTEAISKQLAEISKLSPSKNTIQNATSLLKTLELLLIDFEFFTKKDVEFPELKKWISSISTIAPSPFHEEDLKVTHTSSSPPLSSPATSETADADDIELAKLAITTISTKDELLEEERTVSEPAFKPKSF